MCVSIEVTSESALFWMRNDVEVTGKPAARQAGAAARGATEPRRRLPVCVLFGQTASDQRQRTVSLHEASACPAALLVLRTAAADFFLSFCRLDCIKTKKCGLGKDGKKIICMRASSHRYFLRPSTLELVTW